MTLWIIFGGIGVIIGAAIYFHRSGIKLGATTTNEKNLDRGIQGLDAARKAVDATRRDPVARDKLRDKFRGG